MAWRPKFRISWPSTTRIASRLRKSRTSLQRRSGCIGSSSRLIALSCSAPFSASSVRSLPVHGAYLLGLTLPSASARSCSSTARASPAIGTSTGRLCPSSAGSTSTWITFMLAEARRPPELDHPVEARADGQHAITLGERGAARVQERQRVILGNEAARDRLGPERNAGGVDERPQRGSAVRPPHAAAGDDDGPLRACEERDGLLDRGRITERPRCSLPRRRVRDRVVLDLLAEDVARQVDIDGARPTARRLAEGGRDDVGDALGVVNPLRPLGDGLEHGQLVDLLERLHAEIHARAGAADGDQRRAVGERGGHTGEKIRGAGAGGGHADAGPSRDARPRVGRERRGLLVAMIDRADAELDARRFGLEHRPAHQIEHRVDALRAQRLRQHLRARDRRHRQSFRPLRAMKSPNASSAFAGRAMVVV